MKRLDQELPDYRKVISLIPGGTLQFLDLGFNIAKLSRIKTEFLELEVPTSEDTSNVYLRCLNRSDDGEYYVDVQTGDPVISPKTGLPDKSIQPDYSISIDKALAPFINKWVPLPFFRSEGNIGSYETRYRYGPTDWARARIEPLPEPDSKGNTHSLVISFDTHIQNDIDITKATQDEGYASLSEMDMHDGAELSLVTQFKSYAWFLSLDWMRDWLSELFQDTVRQKFPNRQIRESDFKTQTSTVLMIDISHSMILYGEDRITPEKKWRWH